MVAGKEDLLEVPSEQVAEAMQASFWIVLKHLPNIAGAVDIARGEVAALTRRVEALEQRIADDDAG